MVNVYGGGGGGGVEGYTPGISAGISILQPFPEKGLSPHSPLSPIHHVDTCFGV